jgi:hypothetical protein
MKTRKVRIRADVVPRPDGKYNVQTSHFLLTYLSNGGRVISN